PLLRGRPRRPRPRMNRRPRWIFLAVSAAIVVATLVIASRVLLPFVLALLIAYVLTPAVAWVETKRVPRALAILLVYVVVLGVLGTSIRLMAPRLAAELVGLRRELPAMAIELRDRWVPAIQERLRGVGMSPPEAPEHPAER